MTILDNGRIGINNSSPDQKLKISGNIEVNSYDSTNGQNGYYTGGGLIIGNAYDAGKTSSDDRNAIIWYERGLDMDFATANTRRMRMDYNGNIGAPNGTNIYNASDERLKENMIEITDGLDKVKQLKPISFTWKDDFCKSENGLTQYGFGAQTTQAVDELLVQPFGEGDIELNGETIENPLRVNEKYIIPLLVKAIQEQQEQIETLKAKVAALEGS